MTTYFWVGNSGNWDNSAHWSILSGGPGGFGPPTSTDAVVFDSNSFTLGGQTITIRNGFANQCASLDASAIPTTQTLEFFSNTGGAESRLTVFGNITLPASVAIQRAVPAFTDAALEVSLSGTANVNIGADLSNILFDTQHGSAVINLLSNLTAGAIRTLCSSFTTNNHAVTFTSWEIQKGTFNFGSTTLTQVSSSIYSALITVGNVGTTTINAGTSLLLLQTPGTMQDEVVGGTSHTWGNIHITTTAYTFTCSSTGHTFGMNDFTVDVGALVKFFNGTFVVNGTLTANGGPLNHIIFQSTSSGTPWQINSPTNSVLVNYVDVKDSVASGITPFVSHGGTNNGGNTNWSFTTGNTVTTQNQLGKASIFNTEQRHQLGIANIQNANVPTIENTSDGTFSSITIQGNTPVLNCANQVTGVVYGTNPNPTISDQNVTVGEVIGPFFVDVTTLTSNTTYYIRPYYLCSGVYHYGQQIVISTPVVQPLALPATDNLVGIYRWQMLDQNNNIIADLSGYIFNRRFVIERNRPEEITFTISLFILEALCAAIHITAEDLLRTGLNTVKIIRKGVVICAGQVDYWTTDFSDPTSPVVNVKAHGWLALLGYRVFSGKYDNKDANFIIQDMITQTQALSPGGDFGITLGASAAGSNTYVQKIFENKNIKDAIVEFSEEATGIDFSFTWDKIFNLYLPIGSQRQDILFTYPGNTLGINISSDSTRIVNNLLGRAQGNAGANINTNIFDTTSETTYKQRQAVEDFPDINSVDQLVNMTGAEVTYYKKPLQLQSITYLGTDAACPVVGSYSVGDSVRILVNKLSLFASFNGYFQIDKQTVQLGQNDEETVELSLNQPPI